MLDLSKLMQVTSSQQIEEDHTDWSIQRLFYDDLRSILGIEPEGFIKGFYGGSRVIVDPPPTDTDNDLVLLVDSVECFHEALDQFSWDTPHDMEYGGKRDTFATFRKGEYNLMVFEDATEFGAVLGATAVAKRINIKSKMERYALFETARSPWR